MEEFDSEVTVSLHRHVIILSLSVRYHMDIVQSRVYCSS
jgi:hypothetical protein